MRPGEFDGGTAFSIYLILIVKSALTRTEFRNLPESTSSTERPRHSIGDCGKQFRIRIFPYAVSEIREIPYVRLLIYIPLLS